MMWSAPRSTRKRTAAASGDAEVAYASLVVYDDREGSSTRGELDEIFLGPDSYALAIVPPGVWNGFKGMSAPHSIVANACTRPHDPSRSRRLDPFENESPNDWSVRQH